MYKIGMELLPFGHLPFETGLREISNIGCKGVDLWSSMPPLADPINPGDDIDAIKALLKKYDLEAQGLTIYLWPQEEMIKRIDFAADLGIDTVIISCTMEFEIFKNDFLPPLLKQAEKRGVKIAVENHVKNKDNATNNMELMNRAAHTFEEIRGMVHEINHPNFGICLAPPHLWAANQCITNVLEYLIERNKLFFYYVWDINSNFREVNGGGWNFWDVPGPTQTPKPDGTINHYVHLKLLKTLGYEGVVSIKSHGFVGYDVEDVSREMRKSFEYVQNCILNL